MKSSKAAFPQRIRHFSQGGESAISLGLLADAIVHSTDEILAKADTGRRALIVFFDGEDNADVIVFCVRYTELRNGKWNARNKYGRAVMERTARETGGLDLDATDADDPTAQFRQIAAILRASYDLGYHSSNTPDGSFRKIQDRARRPGLNFRHKTGYLPAKTSYYSYVIRRFYVHNYRCLENFELPVAGLSSVLLIGDNGSGKSTVGLALEVLQRIARGTSRVGSLVTPKKMFRGQNDVPVRFEIEAVINEMNYGYQIAFELPEGFKEPRVLEERFTVNGTPVYTRDRADVILTGIHWGHAEDSAFSLDWHSAALPIIQERSENDPLFIFKQWLGRLLILRPVPVLIGGESSRKTLELLPTGVNFGDWFSGILAFAPAAYAGIDKYLKQVMPDFREIRNPATGQASRALEVSFSTDQGTVTIPFEDLSDGEKCILISALVIAANDAYGPLVCFWDEPDNHLALKEVGHFTMALRKAFKKGGQFIATSHNPEAIRSFSAENTLYLYRNSHLEPTIVRRLDDLQVNGDLVNALIRGDVEP